MNNNIFDLLIFAFIALALVQFMLTPVKSGNFQPFWRLVIAGSVFSMATFINVQRVDAHLSWAIFLSKGTEENNALMYAILKDASFKSLALTIASALTALIINKIMLKWIEKNKI
jgi:hypothetical protein